MIALSQAVVVEGSFDQARLARVADALIVTTDGFNLFRDKEKQELIRRLARECGIIILTDSDDAGFKIRKYIEDIAGEGQVLHAYIPEVPGRERRKNHSGTAGLLGVEGIEESVLEQALREALHGRAEDRPATEGAGVSATDFYMDGLSGQKGSAGRRAEFYRLAGIPSRLSPKAARALINRLYSRQQYRELVERLGKEK